VFDPRDTPNQCNSSRCKRLHSPDPPRPVTLIQDLGVTRLDVGVFGIITLSSVLFHSVLGVTLILTATRPVLSIEELSDGVDATLPRGALKESVGV